MFLGVQPSQYICRVASRVRSVKQIVLLPRCLPGLWVVSQNTTSVERGTDMGTAGTCSRTSLALAKDSKIKNVI